MKSDEVIVMRAIALCFKPFLKPEEAFIYCNLGRTQFAKRCQEFRIYKNQKGYFKREELDLMCSDSVVKHSESIKFRMRKMWDADLSLIA